MALNKWIHPRNPYQTPPDFKELAIKYPNFRKFATQDLKGNIHIDFKNAGAVRALTTCLLHKDFDLDCHLPENTLVPTLTLRLNYLLWIQDILKSIPKLELNCENNQADNRITGLDIGTGASCIYPLLAVRHLNWTMLATESDQTNFDAAVENVNRNNLTSHIKLKKVNQNLILDSVLEESERVQFSMCNPPFFSEKDKDDGCRKDVGQPNEIFTFGGEVGFVAEMAKQSIQLSSQVDIFTTMLGHKSSLSPVKTMLASLNVSSQTSTELCQGRTMRWAVAWTFRRDTDLSAVIGTKARKEKKTKFCWSVEGGRHLPGSQQTAVDMLRKLTNWLKEIQVSVMVRKESKFLCQARLTAADRGWRGQRKRRRERAKQEEANKLLNRKCQLDNQLKTSPGYAKFSEEANKSREIIEETQELSTTEACLLEEMANEEDKTKDVVKTSLASPIDAGEEKKETSAPVLTCDLYVRWAGPSVKVDMVFVSGEAGKEGMHQLLQYLKNKQAFNE